MANPNTFPVGNIKASWVLSPTLTPASVAPGTAEQTFTITGLQVGDFIDTAKPTSQAYISLGNSRVSAANTLALQYVNSSTGTLTPTAAEVYSVVVTRPDNLNSSGTGALLTQIT
jgi:hypothetical protein